MTNAESSDAIKSQFRRPPSPARRQGAATCCIVPRSAHSPAMKQSGTAWNLSPERGSQTSVFSVPSVAIPHSMFHIRGRCRRRRRRRRPTCAKQNGTAWSVFASNFGRRQARRMQQNPTNCSMQHSNPRTCRRRESCRMQPNATQCSMQHMNSPPGIASAERCLESRDRALAGSLDAAHQVRKTNSAPEAARSEGAAYHAPGIREPAATIPPADPAPATNRPPGARGCPRPYRYVFGCGT
jgi:hypothetical protein